MAYYIKSEVKRAWFLLVQSLRLDHFRGSNHGCQDILTARTAVAKLRRLLLRIATTITTCSLVGYRPRYLIAVLTALRAPAEEGENMSWMWLEYADGVP